jgi:hypothetical protein
MSPPTSFPPNRRRDDDQGSLQSERPPTYISNVTAAPTYVGAERHNETEFSLTDTNIVEIPATPTGPRYSTRVSGIFIPHLFM